MSKVVVCCLHHVAAVGLLGGVSLADGVVLCAHALALLPNAPQPIAAHPSQHEPGAAPSKLICQVLPGVQEDAAETACGTGRGRNPTMLPCRVPEQGATLEGILPT